MLINNCTDTLTYTTHMQTQHTLVCKTSTHTLPSPSTRTSCANLNILKLNILRGPLAEPPAATHAGVGGVSMERRGGAGELAAW